MNIALLGPTGSGKGTVIQTVAERFRLHPVALGEVLRQKTSYGTALGLLTREYVQSGELVPDEFAEAMIEEALRHSPAGSAGSVLDGFPRTVAQARFLDDLLADLGQKLDAAIYLRVPESVIFERVAGRQPCRLDDEPHILRHRLHVFRRMVAPVLKHYHDGNRLVVVQAEASVTEVSASLCRILDQVSRNQPSDFSSSDLAFLNELLRSRVAVPTESQPALNVLLLGGPGSGKGTQAAHVCKTFAIPHVSTGDLFRDNIKNQTGLGRLARCYMDRGELVPDDLTEQMVATRLGQPDASRGFVLDGFPRTVAQAEALEEILRNLHRKVTGVVHLRVSDDEIMRRLSGRRICRQCQSPFHLFFEPPRKEGICNRCGGPLYQREDDKPETVLIRLKGYHRQTTPLIAYYRDAGVLTEVAGEGDSTPIRAAMLAAVRLFGEEPATVF